MSEPFSLPLWKAMIMAEFNIKESYTCCIDLKTPCASNAVVCLKIIGSTSGYVRILDGERVDANKYLLFGDTQYFVRSFNNLIKLYWFDNYDSDIRGEGFRNLDHGELKHFLYSDIFMNDDGSWRVNKYFSVKLNQEKLQHEEVNCVLDKPYNADYCTSVAIGIDGTKTITQHPVAQGQTEVRIVDPITGGAKGMKPARMSLIPPKALLKIAEVYNYGATKYGMHNFRKGYDWSLSYDAMQRHAMQFWDGENLDKESGCHHLASVVFHALALLTFIEEHPKKDDRYKKND